MTRALALALLLSAPAAAQLANSPTFRALQDEAGKDPAGAGTAEKARSEAGKGFTGEADKPSAASPADEEGTPTYHFEGSAPMKGVNIYTPVRDKKGEDGRTAKPKPEPLVKPWVVGALLGGGLLATGGGIAALSGASSAAAGTALGLSILGGGLLFLGGAAIAAGIIFLILNKKTQGD